MWLSNRQQTITWSNDNFVHQCVCVIFSMSQWLRMKLYKAVCFNYTKHHDDVIKWKHFPSYWPFVWGIHRSPVNSPHKGQWHGALMFSLICAWISACINNREAGDLRCHRAHYDVNVMIAMNIALNLKHFSHRSRENIRCWSSYDLFIYLFIHISINWLTK